jgi:hypothetical protein
MDINLMEGGVFFLSLLLLYESLLAKIVFIRPGKRRKCEHFQKKKIVANKGLVSKGREK